MGRLVAIDYGRKRCGIAVSDPLRIIATPLETVRTHDLEAFLTEYCRKESVDEFVVGYPRTMNNEPSEAVKYIDPFLVRLGKLFPGTRVSTVDERFSSKSAMQAMIEGGVRKSRRQNKDMVDRVSASIILQTYMNRKTT